VLGAIGLANAGRRLPPAGCLTDARARTRKTQRLYFISASLDPAGLFHRTRISDDGP
jgi:hypothetical protein